MLYPCVLTCCLPFQAAEEEKLEREEAKRKREQAVLLESRRGQEVNENDLMNNMFGFLDDENAPTDGRTTDAFGEMFYGFNSVSSFHRVYRRV